MLMINIEKYVVDEDFGVNNIVQSSTELSVLLI
jgi:hypothetical protein